MHSLRYLAVHFGIACLFIAPRFPGAVAAETANLALVANPSTSYVSGHERLEAINDGFTPRSSEDKSHGTYGNWPRKGTQWAQYDWPQPVFINAVQVYWFVDGGGLKLPVAARLKYWDGSGFVAVPGAVVEVNRDRYNEATFPELSTSKLRLEFDSDGEASTAVVEWRVLDSGKTPNFPPIVRAGVDRTVVGNGRTYLEGSLQDDHKAAGSPV
ncbi:Tat pathway signal protein, partial [bacterium]|nr:Tat pathway signal protein [bacterium]